MPVVGYLHPGHTAGGYRGGSWHHQCCRHRPEHQPDLAREGPGTEAAVVHTAEKEGHQDLIVGYTAVGYNHRTDLLVLVLGPVLDLEAGHIVLVQIGLKGVGTHMLLALAGHQTDLAGLVHRTAVAAADQEVGLKEERSYRAVDQEVHRKVVRIGQIGVYLSVTADRSTKKGA